MSKSCTKLRMRREEWNSESWILTSVYLSTHPQEYRFSRLDTFTSWQTENPWVKESSVEVEPFLSFCFTTRYQSIQIPPRPILHCTWFIIEIYFEPRLVDKANVAAWFNAAKIIDNFHHRPFLTFFCASRCCEREPLWMHGWNCWTMSWIVSSWNCWSLLMLQVGLVWFMWCSKKT